MLISQLRFISQKEHSERTTKSCPEIQVGYFLRQAGLGC